MLFIFRQLRRLELRQRSGRYFLYAVGEVVLIVIGILIAVQIGEWRERLDEEQRRLVLIENLKGDFQVNLTRVNSNLEFASDYLDGITRILEIADGDREGVTMEEVRENAEGLFRAPGYEAALSAYTTAQSTGEISLLDDPEIYQLLLDLDRDIQFWIRIQDASREVNFLGGIYDLAKLFGSKRVLYQSDRYEPTRFALTEDEFFNIIETKEAYAVIENIHTIKIVMHTILSRIKETTEHILARLEELE